MITPLLLLLLLSLVSAFLFNGASSVNQEGRILLEAKDGLEAPPDAFSSWNADDDAPCAWNGVGCSSSGSVTSVNLTGFSLTGPFPSTLCRLPHLASLDLSANYINGTLAGPAFAGCDALSVVNLSLNNLVGPLPDALAALPNLTSLDLSSNNFSGGIPAAFGRFPQLETLNLVYNLLTSTVPDFLGGVSTLRVLDLRYNLFDEGPIPESLGNLSVLENLSLGHCNLNGEIPSSLGRLSRLAYLDLSFNHLQGGFPEFLAELPGLIQVELYNNSLSGRIPAGLGKLAELRFFDASLNQLIGPLPDDIFDAPLLESFHLHTNQLTGGIPAGIARSKSLADLRLYMNQLNGSLPADLGKTTPLVTVDLSTNNLSGEIPASICDRGVLEQLLLLRNSFSGRVPDGLGRCRTLFRLRLQSNALSGPVPSGIWGLPHLSLLDLRDNVLSGSISPLISGAANLSSLLIEDNQFSDIIPSEIGAAKKLIEIAAGNNRLAGPLPASLGDLANLIQLDLHNNSLSGELLRGIHSWKKLTDLNLAHNGLTGGVPPELGSLPVLNYLDLSNNDLTGEIPDQLQNLKLSHFNFSNNQLSGKIPPMFADEAFLSSFLGNPGLCGDIAGLCPASRGTTSNRHGFLWLLRSTLILAGLILIAGLAWFTRRYCKYKKAMDKSKWTLKSFHKLGFSEYEILDSLDEENLIGSGASGKVYKVVLSSGETVAVKKLWCSSKPQLANPNTSMDDAFEAEVATLGKIRHKNIVKLWCCCTHKDNKLLVYEYMPNGSLGDLLHSSKVAVLDWPTRYKIALDAAEGLSYLHHGCVPPIVHRDVKSNNILLDGEFGAKVADFGVAKAVEVIEKGPKSMSVIAGSCGYIAPEYAYTLRVNEKSDIYSFGVVILELITGKLPVDPEYGEKDLVNWVCSMIEHKGMEHVVDTKLDLSYKEEIIKVLNIGLLCASSLPINRPSMKRVVKMLQEVRPQNKANAENDRGKLSPYYNYAAE
ncbi:receptor-like protein kinase HSL1 [Zingiber officinale]|uniref:non-specific serine/threonine protein kinase n=1 Tax=Zingiber officinale TaxID=94328 RepID=A0A8J5KHY9_ZINOF|nr:receptor-like protein kinase HSL1 [Zingiber officinale]KAG6477377.1 hypothetical protein ZIOFF_066631 [Zingiber officinale]